MNTRRMILTGIAGVAAVGGLAYWQLGGDGGQPAKTAAPDGQTGASGTSAPAPKADEIPGTFALGDPDAPITVYELASMTCPHCAHFTLTTFPEVKTRFIETGKIRFVFLDFPLDQVALQASMLVRCAGADKAEALVEMLFRTQGSWARSPQPVAAVKQSLKLAGLGDARADACLADDALKNAVAQTRFDAEKRWSISSTPSFVIGDKVQSGAMTIEEFTDFLKANGLPD
ncbi:DsbA family protein [Zavarzinia compransoris]|uniref:DsbA family protein n=1 Tax=Zavarzinia marina TaxID=2911065 RepID=UPI001F472195|nr:DsbA family protein [Zavarzinia marina]MCF4165134.1 DsbA family protein [Zavarzinia marina]